MAWTSTTTRASGFLVTAAVWNSEHVDNMTFLEEVGYAQITSDVTVTATTEATANSVVSLGAITYEAVPHMIEFSAPDARTKTSSPCSISSRQGIRSHSRPRAGPAP